MSPSRSQAPCMARLRRLAECLDNATTTPTSDLKMPLDQKRVVSMLDDDDDDDNANDGQSESSSGKFGYLVTVHYQPIVI